MKFRKPFMRGRAVSLTGVAVLIAATAGVIAAQPASAAGPVAYNSVPSPIPGNLPSLGFEATSTQEFGDHVGLASNATGLASARVLMSSWGCESGGGVSCVTTPGSTFSVPITFKVYAVNPGPTVGALITSKTQTFAIPYRPSADNTNCSGGPWYNGSSCFNGFATPITFTFASPAALPSQVIWTVSYNTTHHGYSPVGESASCFTESGGCGYDSLNVALNPGNSAGTDIDPDGAFWNTSYAGFYCDNGAGGTNTLRLDTGVGPNCTAGNDWTGYTPSAQLTLAPSAPGAPRPTSAVPGNGSVKVFWKAPASNGGSPVTGYVVTPYKANVAETPVTFNSTATTQVIPGLTNGTKYTFKVAAKNAIGTGAQSPATGSITAGAPGRPGNPKATQGAAAGRLKVTFTVPASNGAKVTSYSAICKSSNGGTLVGASRSKSPIGVTGATSGKSYRCVVNAKNSRGTGPASLDSTPPVIAP